MIETTAASFVVTPQMLIVADDAAAAQLVSEAAVLAGGRIEATLGWDQVAAHIAEYRAIDVIVAEAVSVSPELLTGALLVLDEIALGRQARIIITLAEDQIDLVAATLFGPHVQLLCRPSVAERVVALTIAARTRNASAHESSRDGEEARLRRLNEEVARIAETLARLTRSDSGEGLQRDTPGVGDRRFAYASPPPTDATDIDAQDIRAAIRARRLRGQYFDAGLLEDPAWDMLLDLFAAELERSQVSVSSLCIAAAVAPTTALRWIAKMSEAGLFERHADPFDRRRAFMALSATARAGMIGYLTAAKRAGLPIA
ncbi:MAG: MarR family winged helix-turn-helix transcriptional regulator [Pseudomonadota bacterium]|uniref:MarR family winged helix-turn-helix transcriptional regulator n=1 Tax=Sphingomonas sp. ERG5 TaxID=1381597 RepID=UPI000690075F|nr:MarR family winged helix-turn-helix transcriptional regulator [Sphingomonas sp. ERG5]